MSLNGRTRIFTLELSKLEEIVKKPAREMSVQELWAVYFRYLTDNGMREKINEIIEQEEGIAMASEVLLEISRDEVERARLNSEYKYQLDMQSKLVHAKREARKEGLEEGKQVGLKTGRKEGLKEGRQEGRQEGLKEGLKEGKSEARKEIIDLLKSGKSPEEIIREYDSQG